MKKVCLVLGVFVMLIACKKEESVDSNAGSTVVNQVFTGANFYDLGNGTVNLANSSNTSVDLDQPTRCICDTVMRTPILTRYMIAQQISIML